MNVIVKMTEQTTKICSKCKQNKSLSEFKDRLLFCRTCYNVQQKEKRAARIQYGNNDTMNMLLDRGKTLNNLIRRCPTDGYSQELVDKYDELGYVINIMKHKGNMLSLKTNISQDISEYLKKAQHHHCTLNIAIRDLTILGCDEAFEKVFGMKRADLVSRVYEIEDLKMFMLAIEFSYGLLVEYHNLNYEKMNISHTLQKPKAEHNVLDNTIYLVSNPLNLTVHEFLTKIAEDGHWGLRPYKDQGHWDKLIEYNS
jgi:hypothetical protein